MLRLNLPRLFDIKVFGEVNVTLNVRSEIPGPPLAVLSQAGGDLLIGMEMDEIRVKTLPSDSKVKLFQKML